MCSSAVLCMVSVLFPMGTMGGHVMLHACDPAIRQLCWERCCVAVWICPLTWARADVPPRPCNSHALVQATVGVGTVLIWYLILIQYQM